MFSPNRKMTADNAKYFTSVCLKVKLGYINIVLN